MGEKKKEEERRLCINIRENVINNQREAGFRKIKGLKRCGLISCRKEIVLFY